MPAETLFTPEKLISGIYPEAVKLRREIHRHPDLSGSEHHTVHRITAFLKKCRIPFKLHMNGTGITGTIKNGRGKTVVLRADIDALPIDEQTGLSFASVKIGTMHACGHDMHTAMLAGAGKVLSSMLDAWQGTVILLFQPSEEMEPGGARGMIDCGAFPRKLPDAVFGLHVNPELSTGRIGIISGADFAGVLNFSVTVSGHGGHAARPSETVNPILCASSIIAEISSAAAAVPDSVLAIGTMWAGKRSNIIPDEAIFTGTIRTHSAKTEAILEKLLRKTAADTALAFNAKAAISFEKSYPPSFNDPALTERIFSVFSKAFSREHVIRRKKPIFYAEDFAYYEELCPGLYVHLGVRPKSKKTIPGLHNAAFSPDETAIRTGIMAHVLFALDLLKKS